MVSDVTFPDKPAKPGARGRLTAVPGWAAAVATAGISSAVGIVLLSEVGLLALASAGVATLPSREMVVRLIDAIESTSGMGFVQIMLWGTKLLIAAEILLVLCFIPSIVAMIKDKARERRL